MRKSIFVLILFFIFLSSYNPKVSSIQKSIFDIKEITIENNLILDSSEIKKKLDFIYKENIFFLDLKKVEKNMKKISFIESFKLKKIYPNKLKLVVTEKKPIAILQNKKKKFYISDKGSLIDYREIETLKFFPIIIGDGSNFYTFYLDLKKIEFPIQSIKSFYFFDSGRWDLIMQNGKVIKLPIKNYLKSLKNFMDLRSKNNFDIYKIFDYRIKKQLILN
jgi:cell division protein FtsQ